MVRYNLFLWSVKGSALDSSITVNVTSKVLLCDWGYSGPPNLTVVTSSYHDEVNVVQYTPTSPAKSKWAQLSYLADIPPTIHHHSLVWNAK